MKILQHLLILVNINFNIYYIIKNQRFYLLTLVNALWTNMNKQWRVGFLLTNINKD